MGRRLAWSVLVLLAVAAAPSTAAAAVDYAGYNRLADAVWAQHGDRCSGRAQVAASALTWVRRMWLPDGSRKPESMPYGRSSGFSTNSTPRAESRS